MKALHVLRHAKSSWDDPSLDDFDRPLAPRGRRAAKKLGAYVRAAGIEPALVLCSPARRTVQTLQHLGPLEGEVRLEASLYGGSADELLAVVRTAPAHVPSILLIGHNPGLQDLAVRFAAAGDARQIGRMREKMPTGAMASFEVDAEAWDAVAPRAGRLVGYVVPKELSG